MVDQLEKDKIDRIDLPGKRFLIYGQNEKVNSVPLAARLQYVVLLVTDISSARPRSHIFSTLILK